MGNPYREPPARVRKHSMRGRARKRVVRAAEIVVDEILLLRELNEFGGACALATKAQKKAVRIFLDVLVMEVERWKVFSGGRR